MTARLRTRAAALILGGALVLAACGGDDSGSDATDSPEAGGTVTVYTGRHYGIESVFEAFTAATGIEVRFTTGSDPLLRERLEAEGKNTPADVLMTADAGNLALAAADGLLAPVTSDALEEAIPANLQDAENRWFALSRRARVIMVSDRVPEAEQPTTYAAVGDPMWKGKVCLRPATHPYTQSLVSALIAGDGADAAAATVEAWVANDPTYIDSDTKILEAIEAGECEIGITNSYYLGRILKEKGTYPVRIVWPEQQGRGTHVNISGAGVTANAVNPAAAQVLIEWLATDGQKAFADANMEYPAAVGVEPDPILVGWGEFVADPIDVSEFGRLQPEAVTLLDTAGYQ